MLTKFQILRIVGITLLLIISALGYLWYLATRPNEVHPFPGLPITVVGADEEFKPVMAVQRQPLITEFDVMTVADATGKVNDNELVLGVAAGGKARAYPINVLYGPRREILNDTLGGVPLAATW